MYTSRGEYLETSKEGEEAQPLSGRRQRESRLLALLQRLEICKDTPGLTDSRGTNDFGYFRPWSGPALGQAQHRCTGHIDGTTPLPVTTKNPLLSERRRNDVSTTSSLKPSRPGEGCVVGRDCVHIPPISKGQDQWEDLCVPIPTRFAFPSSSFV